MVEHESPVEKLTEELHEEAEHAREAWLKWAAMLSVLFAVMAAVSGLTSDHYADSAMIEQIKSSDQWSYYQAKSIKLTLTKTEGDILKGMEKPADDQEAQIAKYEAEQDKIKEDATKLSEQSEDHLEKHEVLARTVTLCQVAIAIIAIAVLTRRRYFLLASAALGALGLVYLVKGFLMH